MRTSTMVTLVVCGMWFSASRATAQVSAGSIGGVVTDSAQALVQGATVRLQNTATGATREVPTNETGYYVFANVLPAVYDISVTATGFKSSVRKELQVQVNQNLRVDVQLEVGEVRQSVELPQALRCWKAPTAKSERLWKRSRSPSFP